MQLAAISWNLFHGRDFPPDRELRTPRSRLLRISERNATHIQVNRGLLHEFATVLNGATWDVALLQECPPRWRDPLARACKAEPHRVFTSRNSFGALRALAARLNPDLIASNEGGSNLTLVRRPEVDDLSVHMSAKSSSTAGAAIVERRELAIHTGPLERRAMAFTRSAVAGQGDLCVANLHASAHRPELAAADVLRAAAAAAAWAGGAPLIFGGDLNLRPDESPDLFAELRDRFGLAAPTGPRVIDHLLVRGLEIVESPRQWPPERREVRVDGLALRLSDHAPVEAVFRTPPSTVMR